ncbi:hypothetical protein NPIL_528441, partial [Nephila pilipes]
MVFVLVQKPDVPILRQIKLRNAGAMQKFLLKR